MVHRDFCILRLHRISSSTCSALCWINANSAPPVARKTWLTGVAFRGPPRMVWQCKFLPTWATARVPVLPLKLARRVLVFYAQSSSLVAGPSSPQKKNNSPATSIFFGHLQGPGRWEESSLRAHLMQALINL